MVVHSLQNVQGVGGECDGCTDFSLTFSALGEVLEVNLFSDIGIMNAQTSGPDSQVALRMAPLQNM